MSMLLKHCPYSIASINTQGVFQQVNPAFEKMTGYTSAELINKQTPAIFYVMEEIESRARELSFELNKNITPGLDVFHSIPLRDGHETRCWTVRSKDGCLIKVKLTISALYDDQGCHQGFCGIGEDVTEQDKQARLLGQSQQQFHTALEFVQDGAWDWDLEKNNFHCSTILLNMLGYEAADLMSIEDWQTIVHKEDLADVKRKLCQHAKDGKAYYNERRLRLKSGEYQWFDVKADTLSGADGRQIRMFGVMRNIHQRKILEQQVQVQQQELQRLAYYDSLTNLPNRTTLMGRLRIALTAAARFNTHVALLFIDLDKFKYVNDTFGHNVGDLLLLKIATTLQSVGCGDHFVARLGGDEFAILLEQVGDMEQATRIAEQYVAIFKQSFRVKNYKLKMSASIGVALYPMAGSSPDELLQHADAAMYLAKAKGCNNIVCYDRHIKKQLDRRQLLEQQLHCCLERDELHLVYQPQMSLQDDRLIGVEALVRWTTETLGEVSPDEFVVIAEESRLIIPIGAWIVETALADYERLQQITGNPDLVLSINLSMVQLGDERSSKHLEKILQKFSAIAANIHFELTETAVMENVKYSVEVLNHLSRYGVSFVLDDFGVGYSSMQYLKHLPISALKIDKGFVRDMVDDENDAAIVVAIIALAKTLQLNVVAEGVESKQQYHLLQQQGCLVAQGYYCGEQLSLAGEHSVDVV